jgi:hypothetical protein
MTREEFFPILQQALQREEERRIELSDLTRISIASLRDLRLYKDEWYDVVPLYKLRILCGLIGIDFERAFNAPKYEPWFEARLDEAVQSNLQGLIDTLYMDEEFWPCFDKNIQLLNLFPIRLSDDIATCLGLDLGMIITLLGLKS